MRQLLHHGMLDHPKPRLPCSNQRLLHVRFMQVPSVRFKHDSCLLSFHSAQKSLQLWNRLHPSSKKSQQHNVLPSPLFYGGHVWVVGACSVPAGIGCAFATAFASQLTRYIICTCGFYTSPPPLLPPLPILLLLLSAHSFVFSVRGAGCEFAADGRVNHGG